MLKFNGAWRFDPPATLDSQVISEFSEYIARIVAQGNLQDILEHFKNYFAMAAGTTSSWSSSAGWAETDLQRYMNEAAQNAPLFIAAFYDACESLKATNPEIHTPGVPKINALLLKHGLDFELRPPNLVARGLSSAPIRVLDQPASLDEQAQNLIHESLQLSEQLLAEGRHRPAVQEILWLLETISTAFQGLETRSGTVQRKYFNKIAEELRRHHKGTTLEQVLTWTTTLHGYLSSPTGGGLRHGTNLKVGVAIEPNEARLFCNLIRSYISFLMAEYARLSKT